MAEAEQIITVVILGLAAMVGIAVLAPIAGVATDMGVSSGSDELDPVAGESYVLDRAVTDSQTLSLSVSATREKAVSLSGDGYVETNVSNWSNDSWTVAATASLDSDANQKATYNLIAHDNATILVEYADGNWRAIHYSENKSAVATMSASDPTSLSSVVVEWDETSDELTLTTAGGSTTGALTNETPTRHVPNNWDGTVDEIRFFNGTISDSSASAYISDPIDPLASETHAGRVMFEEGSGSSAEIYYASTSATINGGTWTNGVKGPALEQSVDYQISVDPLQLTITESSYLEGAPVAYVAWDSGLDSRLEGIINGASASLDLVPIIMLVMLAGLTVAIVQRMR